MQSRRTRVTRKVITYVINQDTTFIFIYLLLLFMNILSIKVDVFFVTLVGLLIIGQELLSRFKSKNDLVPLCDDLI